MNISNKYPTGVFNWIDLAANNINGAKAFYAQLFGWLAHDISVGPGMFTMFHSQGQEVASLYQLSAKQRAQGMPSHWMAYVAVASAEETAQQARTLGAQILISPFDFLDLGRIALILDPTGVPFGVWQAGRLAGTKLRDVIAWHELMTPAPVQAAAFYRQLFSWQVGTTDEGNLFFFENGTQLASLKQLTSGWPQWRVYFGVSDGEAAVNTALAASGRVIDPLRSNWPGSSVLIQDPQGAVFGILELSKLRKDMK